MPQDTTERPTRVRRRPVKPVTRALMATVCRVVDVTPHLVRITVTAPELRAMNFAGSDHYFRMLLPRPGQPEPTLPPSEDWYVDMLAMPADVRPILRNYTVKDLRPDDAELDVDMVRHGDAGPGSRWALNAAVGDRIGVIDQGVFHEIDQDATDYLVIADETAVPAALSVIADLGPGVRVQGLLEVPSAADVLPVRSDADVSDVRYVVRGDPHDRPGSAVVPELGTLRAPRGRAAGFIAGESRMTTTARRHLVGPLGIPKAAVCFSGYFRFGRAQYAD